MSFSIGMVKISDDLTIVRDAVKNLQHQIESDEYLNQIPSVRKKINNGGFFFHATDDPPEVREVLFKYIKTLNCSLEIVVGRKITSIYINKHHSREAEFYSDILSHLIKNKLRLGNKLVLNIAARGNTTNNKNLQIALNKAITSATKKWATGTLSSIIIFNVQNQRTEPILNIADYLCWAVQRVFERGEMRYYEFINEKISLVLDLYDASKYEGSRNYYRRGNPLTKQNKISPPSP